MKAQNLIDNEFLDTRKSLPVYEPATGEQYGTAPDSDADDINAAVAAARRAAPGWAATSVEQRAGLLIRLADAVESDLERLAAIESRDTGKPLSLARSLDIPRAVANLRFFASAITQFASESHIGPGGSINYTLRQPLGPVACISPWNLPLYLFTWKIAPALAAGNTVVGKPSEVTPATAFELARLAVNVGFPPGVLNIVHGQGLIAGASLSQHDDIKAISFTGSTRAGAFIADKVASKFVKTSLEMGGKNPTIVFADADLDAAVAGAVRAGFSNQGQICLCGSRILIQRDIYHEFTDRFVTAVNRLKLGDPKDQETDQGALVSAEHMAKVLNAIKTARSEGGEILAGGEQVQMSGRCADGWFVQPTVITGLGPECKTNQEEIFGPVVTLQPFDDEKEAVQLANASEYGLAASVWSSDVNRCHRMAASLEAGIVWVNCWLVRDLRTPFGGVKNSGLGREGGLDALRFFTEAKNVCVQVADDR